MRKSDKKAEELTPGKLAEIKRECAAELARVRHSMLVHMPFVGGVAMRFDLVPVRDRRCMTACTDGSRIYFSIPFMLDLDPLERRFVMAHEVFHSIMLTFARKQTRDARLWNAASDMEINNILAAPDSGLGASVPENLLFPPESLKGSSAEVIYDYLLKKSMKENKGGGQGNDKQNGQGGKQGGQGGKQGGQGGDGESQEGQGGLSGQFDKHCYEGDEDGEGEMDGEGPSDRWGEMGYDEDFKPKVSPDAAERIREAVVAAAQQCQRDHGSVPAGLEGIVDKLVKPEISWREYLASFVTRHSGGTRRFLPPNRRHLYNDMYFQSRMDEGINGIVAIDTSGSCLGDLPKFFSELKGLVDTFTSYRLTVIQADADVDRVDEYDSISNPLDFEGPNGIEYNGGGGTDYGPVFKYVEENGLEPDFLIYIGDGYADMSYDKVPPYSVMWLITKDGNFDFCDWGQKIRFKESSWD